MEEQNRNQSKKPRIGRTAKAVAACLMLVSPAVAEIATKGVGATYSALVPPPAPTASPDAFPPTAMAQVTLPSDALELPTPPPRASVAAREAALPPTPATRPAEGDRVVVEGLDPDGRLTLSVNRSRLLVTSGRLRSADRDGVAVTAGAPDVATALPVSANSILITAKKQGSTNLIIEDEFGRRQVIEVVVEMDLASLKRQLKSVYPEGNLDVSDANGSIVLRGRVPNLKTADQATQVAGSYATKVLNLIEVSGGQQVMLEVKFAEVSKSVASNLGVNFGYTDGKTFVGNNVGQLAPFGAGGASVSALSLIPGATSPAIELFGNAAFGKSALSYFIQALRQNNLMRVLAEPNLIATSGETASFLAGGEFPIPVTQGGATGAITIEYREYGVKLNFVPVVLGDGRIRLKVAPEVSDLDYSTAVQFNGFVVPGLTTRKVETSIELSEGQTFAIAGLLNNTMNANTSIIPGLGDLPVIGALFRSVSYQRKETELMVMVTPHLVEPMNPADITAGPGEHWRYPNEADLFLYRDLGGEAPDNRGGPTTQPVSKGPAPKFHGEYGFTPVEAVSH